MCTAEKVHIQLVGKSDPLDYSSPSGTLDLLKVSLIHQIFNYSYERGTISTGVV